MLMALMMATAWACVAAELVVKNFLLISIQNAIKSFGGIRALIHAGRHHRHVLGVQGAHAVQTFGCWQFAELCM